MSTRDELYSRISAQALTAAMELRDEGDGPEKIAILEQKTEDLKGLLELWATAPRRPPKGNMYYPLFCILGDARSVVHMPKVNKLITALFFMKALRLEEIPLLSQKREKAINFFTYVGNKVGEKREEFLPKP